MENNITTPATVGVANALQTTAQIHHNDTTHDYVTVYTSDQPCNKRYYFDWPKNNYEKVGTQLTFFYGTAVRKHVPTLQDLGNVIQKVSENPNQCFGLGFHPQVPVDVEYCIYTQKQRDEALEAGTIVEHDEHNDLYKEVATGKIVACRLKDCMAPSSYILFDKDDGDSDNGQWVEDIASFIHDFDKVDKIIIPSNSSRVGLDTPKWHCYVRIKDAMDIYSLKDRVLSAGNAAGHTVRKVSTNGIELSRIITDCAVFSPERLIYDGKPILCASKDSRDALSNQDDIKPVKVEVTKRTIHTLDTSLIKKVDGHGEFETKKITTVDANGKKSTRSVKKSTGIYDRDHLKYFTPVEMKLGGKTVTKTMQEVVDENLIEKHGGKDSKIRCQSTFDDRGSESFNGILRLGKDGKPQVYDNGSDTTYIIGQTQAEAFAGVADFTDQSNNTASNDKEIIKRDPKGLNNDHADSIPDSVSYDYNGDHSHSDIAELVGNVHFFDNARYVHLYGKWFLWNGKCWAVDENLKHLSLIQKVLKKKASDVIKQAESETDDDEKLIKWACNEAKNLKSAPYKMNIESTIKTDPRCAVLPAVFDSNLKTIGTPIGTVDLVSGVTSLSQRCEYISKQTNVGVDSSQPLVWLRFLDRIFEGDHEVIAFIQRLCGYSLTGLTVEEKLFFLYGKGANGKSKFLEILFYVLGDYARRAPASMFAEQRFEKHPTELAGLKGARLVICSELPDKMTWNEQTIKDLTGGDIITARLMRQDYFDYKPQFNILLAGNHKPRLRNVDESMARRMVLIPFSVTIPKEERDFQLSDKLRKEAGSILNWCVQGAVDYFKQGLKIPKSISDASNDYLESEDRTGEFIEARFQKAPNKKVRFKEVFHSYQLWVRSQGFDFIKTEPDIRKELKERGFDIKRSNSLYWVHGYLLTSVTHQPVPPLSITG